MNGSKHGPKKREGFAMVKYNNLDVIVPTYNRSEYLRIALQAILSSTAQWRKTIILNNASTDNTLEIIEEIKVQFPERTIEVVTNEVNVGNTNNFKLTQQIAENEYTAVFHDDDVIHPEYIERAMVALLNNPNAVHASGGAAAMYNCSSDNWVPLAGDYVLYPGKDNAYFQLLLCRLNFCTSIYKTSAYKASTYFPEKYGKLHDNIFLAELGNYGDCLYFPEICVRWRQHAGSDSNTLTTGPFPEEIVNIISRFNELKRGGVKRCMLFKVLLYNFAYFLYGWSQLVRFCSWQEFLDKLVGKNIFSRIQLKIIRLNINFCNKIIARKARKYWKLSYRNSTYRIYDRA